MNFTFFTPQTLDELPEYNSYMELISKKDNYFMYKIKKKIRSQPTDVLYYVMIYLESEKNTPQEIVVNATTNIIERVTLFISQEQKNKITLNNYCIIKKNKLCKIILNECSDIWEKRFLKIVKDSKLLWSVDNNTIYFFISDAPKRLNSYFINQHFQILLDEDNNIQGFSFNQVLQ